MKFSDSELEVLTFRILARLKEKKLITFKAEESKVRTRMLKVFADNQAEEEALDQQVKQLLAQHEAAFESGQLDYYKMFQLTKQKLAKEKGFIL